MTSKVSEYYDDEGENDSDFDEDEDEDDYDEEEYEIPPLDQWSSKICDFYRRQANLIFEARNNLENLVLEEKPQPNLEEFNEIINLVKDAFANGMDPDIQGPYIDIIENLGGGLKGINLDDPLVHKFECNVTIGLVHSSTPEKVLKKKERAATVGYFIRLLYAELYEWTQQVSSTITYPQLVSRSCQFEDSIVPQIMFTYDNDIISDQYGLDHGFTDNTEREHLQMLLDSCKSTTNSQGRNIPNLYYLYKYQDKAPPKKIPLENISCLSFKTFFENIIKQYKNIMNGTMKEIPLSKTMKHHEFSIDELFPQSFANFVTYIANHCSRFNNEYFNIFVELFYVAVSVDIRLARVITPESIASILSVITDRVIKYTHESYPHITEQLCDTELSFHMAIDWIEAIFEKLSGLSGAGDCYLQYRLENHQDTSDANLTTPIAIAIKPILLKILQTKTNPAMVSLVLDLLAYKYTFLLLPDQVPLSILKKDFWSAITGVFTNPYIEIQDAIKLHHGHRIEVTMSGKTNRLLSAKSWNEYMTRQGSELLSKLSGRGMSREAKTSSDVIKIGTIHIVDLLFFYISFHLDFCCILLFLIPLFNFN